MSLLERVENPVRQPPTQTVILNSRKQTSLVPSPILHKTAFHKNNFLQTLVDRCQLRSSSGPKRKFPGGRSSLVEVFPEVLAELFENKKFSCRGAPATKGNLHLRVRGTTMCLVFKDFTHSIRKYSQARGWIVISQRDQLH